MGILSSTHITPPSTSSNVIHVPPLIIDDPPFVSSLNNNNTPSPILPVSTRQTTRTSHTPAYLQDYVCNNTHASLYPITNYVSHNKLSDQHSCFVLSLHSNPKPKSFIEANKFDCWKQAMQTELSALESTGTWKLVDMPEHV
jgi:hypothetical protein